MSVFHEELFLAYFKTMGLKNVKHLTADTTTEISINADSVRSFTKSTLLKIIKRREGEEGGKLNTNHT